MNKLIALVLSISLIFGSITPSLAQSNKLMKGAQKALQTTGKEVVGGVTLPKAVEQTAGISAANSAKSALAGAPAVTGGLAGMPEATGATTPAAVPQIPDLSVRVEHEIEAQLKEHQATTPKTLAEINKLLQQKYRSEAIKKIKAVGVRDSYSKQFVESILKKNIPVNCDPTMLFDISYYQKQCKSIPERYILLYLFEELEPSFRKKLKQYTATHNLKIICLGKHITGSDIWISSTIENFLSYFNSAEFVVTNTFHGTVFSIIFTKNFAVLDYNKIKVREVLTKFGLESRLTKYDLRILEQKIDYTKVNHILHSFQKESQNYLLQSLSS